MSGVSIQVDAKGLPEISASLRKLAARTRDLTPFFENAGASLVASSLDRFEKGVSPDDTAWTPSHRAAAHGGKTLVDTGRLRSSVTYLAAPDRVTVGTNVVYAAIQQFGGAAGRGRQAILPARPYIGLSPDDRTELSALIQDHLAGGAA